jgi:SagB-type dehydrogenase family enzyme
LKDRHSSRSFREEVLTHEVLSNLLWAAYGINRPESGKRTAPSALNWQEIDIYVTLKEGLYLYEAKGHALVPILNRDIRAETGSFIQPFVKKAPLNLVYVADLARTGGLKGTVVSAEEKMLYAAVSTGAIVQNVYLYCASEGLSTVVRGYVDKTDLARAMGLREDQKIILAQTVGYPE